MVADTVTVVTRKAGEKQAYKWESSGDGTYSLEECEKPKHGTTIILHLGKDFYGDKSEENYTDQMTISGLVKKYSDYIRYPITMDYVTKEKPKDADGKTIEDAPEEEKVEMRTLNSMQPLWTRNKSDIKPEEYKDFFKHQFYEWEDPMEIFHTKAEGAVEYTALLFIPGSAPLICIIRITKRACSCTAATSSSWINARISCRTTCALSKASSIRQTCP